LFAYFSEILIYRLNRISAANMWAFLWLVKGPDWKPPADLDKAKRETLVDLRKTRRAVTAEDFESLARASKPLGSATNERVGRAKAIFCRDLTSDDPALSMSVAPGHVSVIVVPDVEDGRTEPRAEELLPSVALLQGVRSALEPARLLTTHVHVVKPRYLRFGVRATLVIPRTEHPEEVRKRAIEALRRFFDPLKGGPGRKGWPFGRSVYVSEVYELLAKLPGVRLVKRSIDPQTRRSTEELAVDDSEGGRRRLNQDGKLEAIHVNPEELVRLHIQEGDIAVVYGNRVHGGE
jgi:hypothetical protein